MKLITLKNEKETSRITSLTLSYGTFIINTAHFKATDCHNSRDIEHALNSTFKYGGLMCSMPKQATFDLLSEMVKAMRQNAQQEGIVCSKTHIRNAGQQLGTPFCFISPSCIINTSSGNLVNPKDCPFIWIPDITVSGLPKEELAHHISQSAPDLAPLQNFLDIASDILGSNIGVAVLAWSAMVGLHQYP